MTYTAEELDHEARLLAKAQDARATRIAWTVHVDGLRTMLVVSYRAGGETLEVGDYL